MPKATASEKGPQAEETVLNYLKQQNRPFNSTDISLNLKGQVSKPVTQKALIALAEKDLILRKDYGKITVFAIKQTNADNLSTDDIAAMQASTQQKVEELADLKRKVKTCQTELSNAHQSPTNSELDSKMAEGQAEVFALQAALDSLRSVTTTLVTKEELERLQRSQTFWRSTWLKRRKVYKDLWDLMTESVDAARAAELLEELGIDPAEDVQAEKAFVGGT